MYFFKKIYKLATGWIGSVLLSIMVVVTPNFIMAASLTNNDATAQTLVIIENNTQRDVIINAAQTLELCLRGCFIIFPNGDHFAINAQDHVEITQGRARF